MAGVGGLNGWQWIVSHLYYQYIDMILMIVHYGRYISQHDPPVDQKLITRNLDNDNRNSLILDDARLARSS
jgi:hypothetical protein